MRTVTIELIPDHTSDLRHLNEVLTLRVEPGRLIFGGEIDVLCEGVFRTAVAREARRQGGSVVLDLTGIRFLDSGGLTAIYSLSRETDLHVSIEVEEGSLCDRVLLLSQMDRVVEIRRVDPSER
jgi:anti-anti-sigma factor